MVSMRRGRNLLPIDGGRNVIRLRVLCNPRAPAPALIGGFRG